jgi:hypothetical protein
VWVNSVTGERRDSDPNLDARYVRDQHRCGD